MKLIVQQHYTVETEIEAPDGLTEEELLHWLEIEAVFDVDYDIEPEWDSTSVMSEDGDEIANW